MEATEGMQLKLMDLKKEEDGRINIFIQFEDLMKKNNQTSSVVFNEALLSKYDSILVTPDDEIQGVNNEDAVKIEKIPGAFKAVQSMFVSG